MTCRLRVFTILLFCRAVLSTADAGEVTIESGEPRQSITVRIQDMTAQSVLDQLRARYGFEIIGLAEAHPSPEITATMTGSLYTVLARLLRNRNHVIVRSADNASGVEKVILLGESGKSSPAPGVPAGPGSSMPGTSPAELSSH